ncbi:hypothetical protein D3C71_1528450 [compost metagenome]
MIIRVTNSDDFQIIFEVTDCPSLKVAIQLAWQKIASLRPDHFSHSKAIRDQVQLEPCGHASVGTDARAMLERLLAQAVADRKILPITLAIHLFNRHAYGDSCATAVAMQDVRPGRAPEPWIIAGGYPAGDSIKADPDTELTATRNGNNLPRMLEKLQQADKHAAFLVSVNRLRKSALKGEACPD